MFVKESRICVRERVIHVCIPFVNESHIYIYSHIHIYICIDEYIHNL